MEDAEPRFDVTLRGYDRAQVDAYRRRVEALLADLQRRARETESRRSPTQLEAEELLRRARRRAEQQADSITAAAEFAARQLLVEAHEAARNRLDEAEARRRRVEEETAVLEERYRAVQAGLDRLE
jgi:DivIVA domain-containing protein